MPIFITQGRIFAAAALLLAPSLAQAQSCVCPSAEPLMQHLCASAEHMGKMFAAARQGNYSVASDEVAAAAAEHRAFNEMMVVLDQELQDAARKGTPR
jgi:hypothetical protein